MTHSPTSVVILTWNSVSHVLGAVASAVEQTTVPEEVIVVDNASVDGTPEAVERRFGNRVELVRFGENLGYTGAYNRIVRATNGEQVLVLNPDVRLAPDFLERAQAGFDDPRVGIVAGRLMRPDGTTVDSSGQFLGRSRRTIDRGFGQPHDPARDIAGPVLSACGAAAFYRRTMIDDISDGDEFFDADYFAFKEDLEIGWRAWRAGWVALHVPEAMAIHERAGGARRGRLGLAFRRSAPVTAHVIKNRWLAMIRHDRLAAFLADLPWIAARDAALLSALLVARPRAVPVLWRSRAAFARAWRKRRDDRWREGCWGPWSAAVPRREIWPAAGVALAAGSERPT